MLTENVRAELGVEGQLGAAVESEAKIAQFGVHAPVQQQIAQLHVPVGNGNL